jgi:hypothetical protein
VESDIPLQHMMVSNFITEHPKQWNEVALETSLMITQWKLLKRSFSQAHLRRRG